MWERQEGAWCVIFTTLILLLALPSCGGTSAPLAHPELVSSSVPLVSEGFYCPKEYLTWSLKWKGLKGASTQLATGEVGEIDSVPAIIVYSISRSSELASMFRSVSEELTSHVSLETGRPIQNNSTVVEDDETELLTMKYLKAGFGYQATFDSAKRKHAWSQEAQSTIHDVHTILAQLRIWDASSGTGGFTMVQSGRSFYRLQLMVSETEMIRTPVGRIEAVRIEGQATRLRKDGKDLRPPTVRQFRLWRSNDERFLPLRFEAETRFGMIRGALEQFQQPNLSKCIRVPAQSGNTTNDDEKPE